MNTVHRELPRPHPSPSPSLCVFCGSAVGARPDYLDAAREGGGEVVGVIPRALVDREIAHEGLTALHVVDGMHARKALMAELSDAFVALPGGIGTLEELFEVWTWSHLGVHAKPCALLDVAGYWAPLRAMVDHMVAEGFLRGAVRDRLVVATDARMLLDALDAAAPLARPLASPALTLEET